MKQRERRERGREPRAAGATSARAATIKLRERASGWGERERERKGTRQRGSGVLQRPSPLAHYHPHNDNSAHRKRGIGQAARRPTHTRKKRETKRRKRERLSGASPDLFFLVSFSRPCPLLLLFQTALVRSALLRRLTAAAGRLSLAPLLDCAPPRPRRLSAPCMQPFFPLLRCFSFLLSAPFVPTLARRRQQRDVDCAQPPPGAAWTKARQGRFPATRKATREETKRFSFPPGFPSLWRPLCAPLHASTASHTTPHIPITWAKTRWGCRIRDGRGLAGRERAALPVEVGTARFSSHRPSRVGPAMP